jgi:phosphoribosyl-ATP pyrophosphohydrolase/phosphoribosyl-AMP cyclohydrolase
MRLEDLEKIIIERLINRNKYTNSYTVKLVNEGKNKIAKKVGEEAAEVIIESINEDKERLIEEVADLFYHVTVMLVNHGLSWHDVNEKLRSRHSSSK